LAFKTNRSPFYFKYKIGLIYQIFPLLNLLRKIYQIFTLLNLPLYIPPLQCKCKQKQLPSSYQNQKAN